MAKRIASLALIAALGVAVAAIAAPQSSGRIAGTVVDEQGRALPNVKLQLRNVETTQVVARTRADATAAYEFNAVPPGSFIVEIVDDSDRVIGLSPAAALTTGGAVTGLIAALTATTAAGGAFFASTAGILLLVGLGAGVTAGVIAATNDASPSR
jgi:hypothetical protein